MTAAAISPGRRDDLAAATPSCELVEAAEASLIVGAALNGPG